MLKNLLSDAVIQFINILIDLIPEIDIPVFELPKTLLEVHSALYYFLPMDTIQSLFGLTVLITTVRITLAVIVRVKSFIPSMGA